MNIPFELGIDYGSRRFGPQHMQEKKYLILGKDPFDYEDVEKDIEKMSVAEYVDVVSSWVRENRTKIAG